MAVSYASIDSTKMELTPMRVSFKAPGAGSAVDLGGTLSNCVVEVKYEKAEIKADQMGSTVLDRRVKGLVMTVTTELTQVQDKLNVWKTVFPHGTLGNSNATMDFKSMVGDGDLSNAGELTLHPLSQPDATKTFDWTFYKACASAESTITYGPDKQATLKVIWTVLPDTSVTPAKFARHGDASL
jgi:hypothetical protein